jgi:putative SOS response-associated peptidase YedK
MTIIEVLTPDQHAQVHERTLRVLEGKGMRVAWLEATRRCDSPDEIRACWSPVEVAAHASRSSPASRSCP